MKHQIYTQTGDKGLTSLIGGTRVPKNDPRVEAYGLIDELISHIAYLRSLIAPVPVPEIAPDIALLREIEIQLMNASALAASDGTVSGLKAFEQEQVSLLENNIDRIQQLLPPFRSFVLPSPPASSAYCHIVRTVCRKAERRCIPLLETGLQKEVLMYLNRLSDYFFVLARLLCIAQNQSEDVWIQ